MPKTNHRLIRSLHYYNCGHCINRLGLAYRGYSFQRRVFPSGVFLIEHATNGLVLFDTGYSTAIYQTGWRGWLYRTLNPTIVRPQDEILAQLEQDGLQATDITSIIVSHLHPDHIGGLRSFPHSRMIVSAHSLQAVQQPAWSDLLFRSLLPDNFTHQATVVETMGLAQRTTHGLTGYDLFDDGSIILTPLEGHSHGHLGALIGGSVLLAGDACWGRDLVAAADQMRSLARLIQHDHTATKTTLDHVQQLQKQGITVCFSHDQYPDKDLWHEQ